MQGKVMAGQRVRRLRRERGLTQARMAAQLGISTSYLNLIERSQRPVTVPFLLKLGQAFDIDLQRFAEDDEGRVTAQLREGLRRSAVRAKPGERSGHPRRGPGEPGAGRCRHPPLRRLPRPVGEHDERRRGARRRRSRGKGPGGRAGCGGPLSRRRGSGVHPGPVRLFPRARGGRREPLGRRRPRHRWPLRGPACRPHGRPRPQDPHHARARHARSGPALRSPRPAGAALRRAGARGARLPARLSGGAARLARAFRRHRR